MERVALGSTSLTVSRMGIGTEHFGKVFGLDLPAERGGEVLRRGVELGINLWDTSDDYATHMHVAAGLKMVDRADIVVVTKTAAKGSEEARANLEQSLGELGTGYIDVMLCHQVAPAELPQYEGTLGYLHSAKKLGLVRAVGLSSHSAETIRMAAGMPEIEVIVAPLNWAGRCHENCGPAEMREALKQAYEAGKGIYLIKTLSYGDLAYDLASAIAQARNFPYAHSVVIGVKSEAQLEQDVELFDRAPVAAK